MKDSREPHVSGRSRDYMYVYFWDGCILCDNCEGELCVRKLGNNLPGSLKLKIVAVDLSPDQLPMDICSVL